ncbi:hypothetical protein TVAG_438900 [Trichomonas vaginalis G3]|uniref:Uncharacterized protein n=1 Tax=Trichomonas vaginalis (strain ATCC PRA-98 / G3) TaxID=412133 RepID=A2FZ89_TRIV3|nr:hypothetical protein TVAGG3_1040630 [Trichomonas vaginalis G3]EAX89778.1 hypothetical protein TVAG_438900 [Trichomonas vaginalis G3]KAI5493511.1 hypothetical protein TVAGG3_1040630 [Trichomonas vaginalis G3]|eukprot:XP_001302708.1 hypothetical protein [Trichomonas vaginalis G3]
MEAESFQYSVINPQLAAYNDSPEYQHYIRTMGNPNLKMALDSQAKKAYENQIKIDQGACSSRATPYVDAYRSIKNIEEIGTSSMIFQYCLALRSSETLDNEIKKEEQLNEQLQKEYEELIKSCKLNNIPID